MSKAIPLTPEQQEKAARLREFLRERAQDGKIFSVIFTKRTTGEQRRMLCRLGVQKHLKGGEKKFDDAEKGLLTVFDVQKREYRSIACEAITEIRLAGERWQETAGCV